MYFCVMAKQQIKPKEQIKCKDCKFHYNPSMDHLDPDGNPILAWCRKQKFMILLNHINKDCIYNEK